MWYDTCTVSKEISDHILVWQNRILRETMKDMEIAKTTLSEITGTCIIDAMHCFYIFTSDDPEQQRLFKAKFSSVSFHVHMCHDLIG